MIVTRAVYDAVRQIHAQATTFDPDNPVHQTALAAGVAEVNGTSLELTFKGQLVLDL